MSQNRKTPETLIMDSGKTPARPSSNVLPLNFDLLGIETIKKELQKLSATNQELLKAFHNQKPTPAPTLTPLPKTKEINSSGTIHISADTELIAQLRLENDRLKKRLAELEKEARSSMPEAWLEHQRDFEQLLEEKTNIIRNLNMKIQELTEELHGGQDAPSFEELKKKEADLENKLLRLQEDEDSLKLQLREMEMSMAKERADIARQRAELQRLNTDLNREIEIASRDPSLRERLQNLQRRPQEGRPKTMNALPENQGQAPKRPVTMTSIDLDQPVDSNSKLQKGSLFKRLFGG